ncbi:MAG: hypothetical protein ACSLEN_01005 [Candidatus Malihini olakiniferum]
MKSIRIYFLFPPYDIHCYTLGSWEFFISFL